jgi:uridine kinase
MSPWTPSKLIAITGGSGAGKTWLAGKLQDVLGESLARLSLDDFYLDRSDLPPAEREKINFDDPCAIDWPCVERLLRSCRARPPVLAPRYDFTTHTRLSAPQLWQPAPLVLVDGLWLLVRPAIRSLFDLRIFLDCPEELRLQRRLARDVRERGRSQASVRRQFCLTVAPMHERYVVPQLAWADIIVGQPVEVATICELAFFLRNLVVADSRRPAPSGFLAGGDFRSPAHFRVTLRTRHPAGWAEGTVRA